MIIALTFVVTLLAGIPIAYMLGLTGLVHMAVLDDPMLLLMLPQRMFTATDNFSLLAIPLFILAGELMEASGDTERLADFARALVGHVKGGLAYVMVVVGAIVGALMGSANAEAALLGSTLHPELKKDGYDEVFSANLVAAVSILGPIIPPGLIFIVYGVAAGVSIGELFFAGVMPGIFLTIAFALVVYFTARKSNWPVGEFRGFGNVWHTFKRAFFSLTAPIAVLAFIVLGVTTPTESAAAASVIVFILGYFVYKKIKLSDLPPICLRTGVITGAIMLIVATANILGWTMALDQIPQKIAESILSISKNPAVVLLLVNVLLLFVGMVMETVAAVIILVPVFMPIVQQLGLDPIHFGLIVSLNLTIGMLTPPVGVTLFTSSMACNVPLRKMIRPIWFWVGVSVAVLIFVTYFPSTIMFLPRLFFKG